jgi:hypothetical protein
MVRTANADWNSVRAALAGTPLDLPATPTRRAVQVERAQKA